MWIRYRKIRFPGTQGSIAIRKAVPVTSRAVSTFFSPSVCVGGWLQGRERNGLR